ncbi:hypothetical protein [Methylocystis echinoides]|uniref:Flagellar FliJ protein n=1 Tax=Methylocystis echinoides TaxID=29468 RepID=A0A9W6GS42_9HYPH|nr:hypothetical protein [Methylocystis echinoides]GLI91994.1 hypothetical protein LMG27198_09860 [Methylocystis echinoides]
MKSRRDRLARAKDITDQLWRLQQSRLAQAERAVAALRAAESASFQSLDRMEPRLVLPYIATLAAQRAEAEAALARAQESAREYGRRMKLTEKLHKAAKEATQRDEAAVALRFDAASDDVSAR